MTSGAGASVESDRRTVGAQAAVVFAGNVTGTALGFAANVLLMRAMGPEGFGIVIISNTVLTVLWLITGRGVDQALVRCVARSRRDDAEEADAARATVHRLKVLVGGALMLIGLALAGPLTHFLLGEEVSATPLRVAMVSSLAASLWGYTGASLQAGQQFGRFAVVQVSNSGVRLVLTGVLFAAGVLTPTLAMATIGLGYLLAAGVGYALGVPATRRFDGRPALRPVVYASAKWLVVSSLIHLFYMRLDHLMLSRVVGANAVGVYGAAVSFIQIVDLLTFSLLTVWLPRFCERSDRVWLGQKVKEAVAVSGVLAVLAIPAFFLVEPVMLWLLGEAYGPSIRLFKVLFLGAIFTLITHPLQATLHARAETHLLTRLDVGLLVLNGVSNYWAILWYGATGAACVAVATRWIGGLVLIVLVALRLRAAVSGEGVDRGFPGCAAPGIDSSEGVG